MKKIFLGSVAGFLSVALIGAALWWIGRPQVILLANGTKLTLLGVT